MSGRPLLLDLYCKAGGAAMGYWRAGFDVVGVDLEQGADECVIRQCSSCANTREPGT